MANAEESARQINEQVRRTYSQLIKTRNAQMEYMASKRRATREFAFLVTPDLVLQYNYVHQLMKSFRTAVPPDICVEDGGITCSNLSALKFDRAKAGAPMQSLPATAPVTDASDYLASRIVDLLDRPVTIGDQDLTLNVRDEFAANIRTLNLLFEERYKSCQEQSGRLRDELSAARQRLAASRAAGSEAVANAASDRTAQRLREQVARYEVQLRAVREQMETLRDMNENTIRRNQQELEELARRVDTAGRTEHGDAFLRLLQSLVDSLESERDQVLSAIQHIQSVNDRRSTEFSRVLQQQQQYQQQQVPADALAGATEIEKRVQSEVAARVRDEAQNFDRRVEEETSARLVAFEGITRARLQEELEATMRVKLQEELERRVDELKRRFDDEVSSKVAQALGSLSVPVVTSDQVYNMLGQPPASTGDADASLVERLNGILAVKESAFNVVPMAPQYELPGESETGKDYEAMRVLYEYVGYLLGKIGDMYKFSVVQTGYLYNLGAVARAADVPLDSMGRDRKNKFLDQVDTIMRDHMSASETYKKGVLAVLARLSGELSRLNAGFADFYRTRSGRAEAAGQGEDGPLSRGERSELMQLRAASRADRTTIRELQTSLQAIFDESTSRTTRYSHLKQSSNTVAYAQGKWKLEVSLRNELIRQFRELFNELAVLALDIVDVLKRWLGDRGDGAIPRELTEKEEAVRDVLKKADSIINYGQSPGEPSADGDDRRDPKGPSFALDKQPSSRGKKREPAATTAAAVVPAVAPRETRSSDHGRAPSSSRRARRTDRWVENSA